MGFDFHPVTVHAQRRSNTLLTIDGKPALDHMHHFAVMRHRNRPRRIDCPGHIVLVNDPTRDRHYTLAVNRGDMRARQADQGGGDLQT